MTDTSTSWAELAFRFLIFYTKFHSYSLAVVLIVAGVLNLVFGVVLGSAKKKETNRSIPGRKDYANTNIY